MADVPYGYSYETGKTARRYTKTPRKVKGITIHHWGSTGSSFDGIVNWFCAPDTTAQTSCHYVAQGADANGTVRKRVACIVDPDLIAWHAGDWGANVDTIGIECRTEARDADYEVVSELVARLWLVYGVVPLYPHKHWANTACPGKWDLARLKSMATVKLSELKSGATTTSPPAPVPAPAPPVPAPAPVQEDDMFSDADRTNLAAAKADARDAHVHAKAASLKAGSAKADAYAAHVHSKAASAKADGIAKALEVLADTLPDEIAAEFRKALTDAVIKVEVSVPEPDPTA